MTLMMGATVGVAALDAVLRAVLEIVVVIDTELVRDAAGDGDAERAEDEVAVAALVVCAERVAAKDADAELVAAAV